MLFQRPYFASRDKACGPALGSEQRPGLWWHGLSAEIAPPQAGAGASFEVGAPAEPGYASLIIYRRSDGPPPGVLLMEPRVYINRDCTKASHATYYNRIFVPARPASAGMACVNLSAPSNSPGAGARPPKLTRTERLVIMSPDMFDPLYEASPQPISVTLFDGPDCRGETLQLRQANAGGEDFQLAELGFRHRTRSLQVSLNAPDPSSVPVAGDDVEPAPLVTAAPPPDSEPPTESGDQLPGPTDENVVSKSAQPEPPAQEQESTSKTPDPTAALVAKPALVAQPEPTIQPDPPKSTQEAQPPAGQTTPAAGKIEPVTATVGLTIPADDDQSARKTFKFPVQGDYRLNYCLVWGKRCGEPAAQAWCKERGFTQAEKWVRDANIGGLFPTVVMADDRICARYLCDGFKEITCSQ
jgi:hypothetical protein